MGTIQPRLMDWLLQTRLLIDFGCVVMIWMVQLVVYPSFLYYTKENLFRWHGRYTGFVTVVVFPLMMGQLILFGMQLMEGVNWYHLSSGLIILALWVSTFGYYVPLHNSIQPESYEVKKVKALADHNWLRTILWSVLFVVTLVYFIGAQS